MPNNDKANRLVAIYKQIYQYRELLKNSPPLTFDLDTMDEQQVTDSFSSINEQLEAIIAYLLGFRAGTLSVDVMIDALNKHYKKDDFWRALLLDYIEIRQEIDEEDLESQKKEIQNSGVSLYEKLRDFQRRRREIIDSFSAKMVPQKFPVDCPKLFKNYLNMADLDAKQAWEVLTNNPAFFSSLIVEDENGKRVISIAQAKEINKKMGDFIKKLKA